MAEPDFTVHTPGDPLTDPATATVAVPDAPPADLGADEAPEPAPAPPAKPGRVTVASLQARIEELELSLVQAEAANRELIEQNLELKERLGDDAGPRRELVERRPTPIVGRDWRQHTSAEAQAAGVRETVLCSDGYYVPPPAAAT